MAHVDMVEYKTATRLAAQFEHSSRKISDAIRVIQGELDSLNQQFLPSGSGSFDVYVSTNVGRHSNQNLRHDETLANIERHLQLTAWRVLVNKLGIRKLLSSKRCEQLEELLEKGQITNSDGSKETLPEITEETIMGVLGGLAGAAGDFLEEAIREEWNYWKPVHREGWSNQYKTNRGHEFKLERKLIKGYAFSSWSYGGKRSLGSLNCDVRRHLIALDNIMHMLDGRGPLSGYSGPLVDAIDSARHNHMGFAETDFFDAKWFNNGNMHLVFKRQDLLDRFNQVCSSTNLASCTA